MKSILNSFVGNKIIWIIFINFLILGFVYWNISRTCFIIHHGELIQKWPLIKENYDLIIVGLMINIVVISNLLFEKKVTKKMDICIFILYGFISSILIMLGYGYIMSTDHTDVISEYNPLFRIPIEWFNCYFLKDYVWVKYIYTVLSVILICLNHTYLGNTILRRKRTCEG
ncbi:MAG: hypothetical protein Q4E68_08835 [Prevotellaceae bacterium]|nr:hypothetical protein [Prevotellaceae bacterium]